MHCTSSERSSLQLDLSEELYRIELQKSSGLIGRAPVSEMHTNKVRGEMDNFRQHVLFTSM